MAFDCEQFRNLISRVLEEYSLHSPAAANLLLGTAAAESDFGTYIRQVNGPARGIFQMELGTFLWLQAVYGKRYSIAVHQFEEIEWDLKLAILFARLRYRVIPSPLPEAYDLLGLANYWKKYYNTYLGAGTVQDFLDKYHQHVKP